MKSKSLSDPSSVSPDVIESILMQLGIRIAFDPLDRLVYREQDRIPEWRGADVRVTSDFDYEPKDFMEGHDLLVRTQHAKGLTWLIFELRDTFSGWIDAGNKYGFYGALAQAALSHLAANQPESDDARPLLNAVLVEAFRCLQMLREDGNLPPDVPIVCHQRDAEGRQQRINLEDGKCCL